MFDVISKVKSWVCLNNWVKGFLNDKQIKDWDKDKKLFSNSKIETPINL